MGPRGDGAEDRDVLEDKPCCYPQAMANRSSPRTKAQPRHRIQAEPADRPAFVAAG